MPYSSDYAYAIKHENRNSQEFKQKKRGFSFLADYFIDEFSIKISFGEFQFRENLIKKIDRLVNSDGTPGRISEISILEFTTDYMGILGKYIRKVCPAGEYDESILDDAEGNYYMSQYYKNLYGENSDILTELNEDEKTDYLTKIQKQLSENLNKSLERGDCVVEQFPPQKWNGDCSEEELIRTGYQMMLEAVYHLFYDSFDWDQLRYDLTTGYAENNMHNDELPLETIAANIRLRDYNYYIGQLKDKWKKFE